MTYSVESLLITHHYIVMYLELRKTPVEGAEFYVKHVKIFFFLHIVRPILRFPLFSPFSKKNNIYCVAFFFIFYVYSWQCQTLGESNNLAAVEKQTVAVSTRYQ